MAPKRVLRSPPPLPSETISFSTNGHTTGTTGNNVSSFGSSQPMDVGTAATKIPASTALRLSKKFYRTAGLVYPFFRMIKKKSSQSIPLNLVVTLATYFDTHTCLAKIEAMIAAHTTRAAVFHAKIPSGFGFRI